MHSYNNGLKSKCVLCMMWLFPTDFFFFFPVLLSEFKISLLGKQIVLVSVYHWLCPSCYKNPLQVCLITGFFLSFHDKFLCMVSDLLKEKSPHNLQTGLATFDTRQLSYWCFETVIHIQILTVWHLRVYQTFLVAYASVNALRSTNKLPLSIVSIWSTSLGDKEESQLQTKG